MAAFPFNTTFTELQKLTPPEPKIDIITSATGITPVATGSTITFNYPPNRGAASYLGQKYAWLAVRAIQGIYLEEIDFSVVYGDSTITVTYNADTTIPANTTVRLQLPVRDTTGPQQSEDLTTAFPRVPTPEQAQGL